MLWWSKVRELMFVAWRLEVGLKLGDGLMISVQPVGGLKPCTFQAQTGVTLPGAFNETTLNIFYAKHPNIPTSF